MNTPAIQQSFLNKASKDKFMLIFEIPAAFKEWNSKIITNNPSLVFRESLQMSIFGAVVPDTIIPALTIPFAGQSLQLSSHARKPYEESTIGFTIDNRFQNWWVIWKWLDLINDAKESYYDQGSLGAEDKNYMRNYQVDFTIIAQDEYEKPIMQFVYSKAFPTSLKGISYDSKDQEQIVSEFTFAYSQFIPTPVFS